MNRWGNSAPLVIGHVIIAGSSDFVIVPSATTCTVGLVLAPAAQCQIAVAFMPSAPGAESASLEISDNASNNPQSATLLGWGY